MEENQKRLYELQKLTLGRAEMGLPAIVAYPYSIDSWRQRRMYEMINPLLASGHQDRWLTIGDSGADAITLIQKGVSPANIVCSCLGLEQLRKVKDAGHLDGVEIAEINAENIDRPNSSFDYVFGKEVYHHLPRPAIGLYEMMRVAARGVVLIEPLDFLGRPLDVLRNLVKSMLKRSLTKGEFEYYGNYTYRLSLREVRKIATAMSYPEMYVRRFNDFGHDDSNQPASNSRQMRLHQAAIAFQDGLARVGAMSWGKAVLILVKSPLDSEVSKRLVEANFEYWTSPINPYFRESIEP
jgi:hypothetical protein